MDSSAITTTPPLPSGPRPAPWAHGGQLPGSPTRGQASPSSVGRLSNLFARTRIVSSGDATSPGREKPLPALPPARTPSQMSHQRQNQSPYSPRAVSEHRRVSYLDQPPRMRLEQRLPTGIASTTDRPHPVSMGVGPSVSPLGTTGSPSLQRPATQPHASSSGERLPPMPMARPVDINEVAPTPYGLPPLRASSPYRAPLLPRPPIQQQQDTARPPPRPQIDQMRLPPSYEDLYGRSRTIQSAAPSSVTGEKTSTASPAFPTEPPRARPASAAQASGSASANAATVVEVPRPPHSALPSSAPRPTTSQITEPSTPAPQSRQRATSTAPQTSSPAVRHKGLAVDASLPPAKGQCWGIKRDGGRCSRIVGKARGRGSPSKDNDTPRTPRRVRHQSAPPTALTTTTRSEVFNRRPNLILAPHGSKVRPIIFDDDSGSSEDEVIALPNEEDDDETQLPVFCRQHSNEINKSAGFYSSKKGDYIPFADYLPLALLAAPASNGPGAAAIATTLARLRLALSEPLTAADLQEKGYIYVFEYPNRSDPQSLYLKVGRSIRPMKRMAEWRGQCSSGTVVAAGRSGNPAKNGGSTEEGEAQPLLRGLFPSEGEAANQSALLVGAHAVTTRGILGSHRWEKLIHIELSHRAQRLIDDGEVVTCPCGRRHREIFKVSRKELGYQGVKEMVTRWEKAVRRLVEE